MHLRIYECFVPDQPSARERLGFGTWSIGAVHLEHWMFPGMHIVHGWHEAQDFVEDCFAGQTGVNQIWRQDIGNAGWYQGHWFDGEATFIELL